MEWRSGGPLVLGLQVVKKSRTKDEDDMGRRGKNWGRSTPIVSEKDYFQAEAPPSSGNANPW